MTDELAALRERVAALEAKLEGRQTIAHLQAERVDVVEQDGTLRVSVSNAKQSADAVLDGQVIAPGRQRTERQLSRSSTRKAISREF